jgi:hypothetical protein
MRGLPAVHDELILQQSSEAALAAALMPEAPLAAGAILLLGCLGALLVNVARAGRR